MAGEAGRFAYRYGDRDHSSPHPKQALAHQKVADEILFGGAAGPGKTDWLLGHVMRPLLTYPGFPALILRRTFPMLSQRRGIVERLQARIPRNVGTYNQGSHTWKFRNGSSLQLGHLATDADVDRYVGGEYGLIAWDQLEQFTEFQFLRLKHPLRLPVHHPAIEAGFRPHMAATANPGGKGHMWVKGRFVDPAPRSVVWQPEPTEDEPEPGTRVFVPATLDDNPYMPPWYRQQLNAIKDPALRRALAEGDWDVYAGARFGKLWNRNIHVVEPEQLPLPTGAGLRRGLGIDYGLEAPFCALWGAVLPDGLVVVYRELYKPDLTPRMQAEAIREREVAAGERTEGRPMPTWLDPACWARDPNEPSTAGGDRVQGRNVSRVAGAGADRRPPKGSIAWTYGQAGVGAQRANNDRRTGTALIADKLARRPDGRPRLLIYSTCTNLIRTLPGIPRDDKDPELYDSDAEDHAVDALRYLLMGLSPGWTGPVTGYEATPPPGPRGSGVAAETAGWRDRPM